MQTSASGTFAYAGLPGGNYVVQVSGHPEDVRFAAPVRAVTVSESEPTQSLAFEGTTTDPGPPVRPSGLSGTAPWPNLVSLTWTDESWNETSFTLERRTGPSGEWSTLVVLPRNTTAYGDRTTVARTQYRYRLQACGDGGCSDYSAETVVETPGAPPAAPVALRVTSTGIGTIELAWRDISNDESEFRVERREGSVEAWALRTTLPADTEAFTDTGLSAGTEYRYRVRACDPFGCSIASNQVSAINPPAAPSGLFARESGSFSISLRWTDNSDDEGEFRIERRGGTSSEWSTQTVLPPDATSFDDRDLIPETLYSYRVSACGGGVCSAPSNESSATTDPTPEPANMRVPVAYLVQRTQRRAGDVPLVKDLGAWVRVFVTASFPNAMQPEVRVRFYHHGVLSHTEIIPAASESVPLSVDESDITTSWNAQIPASLIQPGLSILVDVDPTDAIAGGE